jgi:hypothetical protein
MEDFTKKQVAKISKMSNKEIRNYPMFVADRQRIYNSAMNFEVSNTSKFTLDP